jgi:tRNA(Ile)-lysidine synthase
LPAAASLIAEVRRSWATLAPEPGAVVVAVSGGPDSVALLRALLDVDAGPLVIAHLNHRLRGPDSDADEQFVRELHASLRAAGAPPLELCCERIDVAAQARAEHDNLESTARRLRYDWLAGIARERQARWVATGHTADDQAETVLHRLLRGTGLKGLTGIPARRALAPGVDVVRPLLRVRRADVLHFLNRLGQSFRVDHSNDDTRLTRNCLRHELLPHLAERYNPAVVPILCRLAEQAEEVYHEVETKAGRLLAEAEFPRTQTLLIFDRDRLNGAARHLIREAFRLAWERENWPLGAMTFEDWDRAAAVVAGEIRATELPGRICVRSHGRVVQVGPVAPRGDAKAPRE